MDKPSTTCLITINKIGIIQSVDNNCFAMFGYSLSELIGQPVTIFIPSPYKEQHDSYLENYHTTGKARIIGRSRTVEGQHKDGTIFTMRLAVSEINIGPSSLYIGLITKIEDTTAIVTIDKYGIIVSCNKNCENLWGYSEDFLIGKNVKLLMPNPHQELHDTYLNNYHETGKMKVIGYIRNVPALHKSGIVFPVCLQVQRIRIDDVEFFRAKVERVEEEREVLFTLDQNGTILSCNKK